MSMNVTPTATAANTLSLTGSSAASWQVGQKLEALVLAMQAGGASLRIGATELTAHTTLALTPGQRLQLEVVQAAGPPVLRLIAPPTERDVLVQALRAVMPHQGSLSSLSELHALADSSSPAVRASAQSALAQIPKQEQVTQADGLRNALRDSGHFLENNLARGALREEPSDLKAALSRLQELLVSQADHEHPTSSERLAGALARIETNQLQMLVSETTGKPTWLVELPVQQPRGIDLFALRIEPDVRPDEIESAPKAWSVWLDFDLEGLGPMRARVSIVADQVSIGLWAEREETTRRVQSGLGVLEAVLVSAGLTVGRLSCDQGGGMAPRPLAMPNLLDERA